MKKISTGEKVGGRTETVTAVDHGAGDGIVSPGV